MEKQTTIWLSLFFLLTVSLHIGIDLSCCHYNAEVTCAAASHGNDGHKGFSIGIESEADNVITSHSVPSPMIFNANSIRFFEFNPLQSVFLNTIWQPPKFS